MVNSVIYFRNQELRLNSGPEFEPLRQFKEASCLNLVPNEPYTQVIDLGTEWESDKQIIDQIYFLTEKNVKIEFVYTHAFLANGRYLFLNFEIDQDYKDSCLRLVLLMSEITYTSNFFTCTEGNRKLTSLVTYRHLENLYGTPYAEFEDIFQQIRIPAYFQRLNHSAEAETDYTPGIIPINFVGRVERVFKEDYTIIATDFLNKAISGIMDCDFIYLENERVIVSPYIAEMVEEGEWFSKSTLTVQKTEEYFNGKITFDQYDLIFRYRANEEVNNEINLTYAFNGTTEIIDWGDGIINSELTHVYAESGDYTIKVKISNLRRLVFKDNVKNAFEILQLPSTLTQIDLLGCSFSATAIENLFNLVWDHNPIRGSIVGVGSGENIGIGFLSHIYVGNQNPPAVLSQTAIDLAYQFLQLNWQIDYFKEVSTSGIPTSSRYGAPENADKLWAENCSFFISTIPRYAILEQGTTTFEVTAMATGNNIDNFMHNFYGILRKEENGWSPVKAQLSLLNSGGRTDIEMYVSEKGPFTYQIGQHKYPSDSNPSYSFMWTKEYIQDVIGEADVLFGQYDSLRQMNISGTPPTQFFQIFPFATPLYVGMGQSPTGLEPIIRFQAAGVSISDAVRDRVCWNITETGTYQFKFVNYKLDFSNLMNSISIFPTFYLAYFDTNGNLELTNGVNSDFDGTITINMTVTLELAAGSRLIPFLNGGWTTPLTDISGFVQIMENSRLIIEKLN